MFRCLNTGIAEANGQFKLRDMLRVNVKCEQGPFMMSGMKLGAGFAASAALVASMI